MKPFCRKTLRAVLLCLLASLPFLGSGSPPPGNIVIPEISQRINAFTLDLLRHYAQGETANQNAVLSPQSIFQGLAISYIASGGDTRKELASVLHFPDDDAKLLRDVAELRRQLDAAKKSKTLDVSMANAIWLDGTYATVPAGLRQAGRKSLFRLAPLHAVSGCNESERENQPLGLRTDPRQDHAVGRSRRLQVEKPAAGHYRRAGPGERQCRLLQGRLGQPLRQGGDTRPSLPRRRLDQSERPHDAPAVAFGLRGRQGLPISGNPLHRRPVLDVRVPSQARARRERPGVAGHGREGNRPEAGLRRPQRRRPAAQVRGREPL